MNLQILAYALLGGLAIGLIFSVYSDIRYRLIYNKVTLPMALAAPLYWFATGQFGLSDIGIHLLTASAVFALFALFFAIGMMGAGDVKLFTALALWFEWTDVIEMMLYTSLIGGVVTIVFLIIHKVKKQTGKVRIPYGVAISLAGLAMIGAQIINPFAR
jgi:prepilin peptidase CpaA